MCASAAHTTSVCVGLKHQCMVEKMILRSFRRGLAGSIGSISSLDKDRPIPIGQLQKGFDYNEIDGLEAKIA